MTLSCNVYLDQDLVLSRKQEIRSGERGYLAEILRKLLPRAKFHLMAKNDFHYGSCPPSSINCKIFIVGSHHRHLVPKLQLCAKFHQNRMTFR